MAKLILKGIERTPRYVGADEDGDFGSFYILVEAPMAKIMGMEKDSTVVADLYLSEKHKDYYLAAYVKKDEKKGKK
jgi:hypothetical protein